MYSTDMRIDAGMVRVITNNHKIEWFADPSLNINETGHQLDSFNTTVLWKPRELHLYDADFILHVSRRSSLHCPLPLSLPPVYSHEQFFQNQCRRNLINCNNLAQILLQFYFVSLMGKIHGYLLLKISTQFNRIRPPCLLSVSQFMLSLSYPGLITF